MRITTVLAVLTVRDLDSALTWYERLLGRPADLRPMDGLAEWHLTDGGALQVAADPAAAGRSLVTLAVDNLDTTISDLNSRDLHVREVVEGAVAKLATLHDPDGNTVTFAEPL